MNIPKTHRLFLLFACVSLAFAATAAIQIDPQGPHAKKYVAFGWEYAYMQSECFISHVAEFEKTALDGIGFNINGDKAAGRSDSSP